MRGTSLGGGGDYSRPILRTTVEILNNEEDENVPNGANNIAATINRAVKVTAVTAGKTVPRSRESFQPFVDD